MIKPGTMVAYLMIIVAMAAVPPRGAKAPALALAPAPPPGPDCMSIMINMADCLAYVENGSKLRKPDPPCCPELSNMIKTQPVCLCKFLANSSQLGLSDIDTNRALKLPALCNVSAPPVKLCAVVGVPVPGLAPIPSPANSSSGSPKSNLSSSSSKIIGLSLVLFASLFYY